MYFLKCLGLIFFLPIFISSGQVQVINNSKIPESPPPIEEIGTKSDSVYRLAEEIARLQNKKYRFRKPIIKYRMSKPDTVYLNLTPGEKDSLIAKLAATIRDSMQPKFIYIDRPILVEKKKKRRWLRRIF